MSSTSARVPGRDDLIGGAGRQARRWPPRGLARWARTPKGVLVGVLLVLVAVTAPGAAGPTSHAWLAVATAAMAAATVDLLLAALRGWGLILPDGALLTGMLLGMVLDPTLPLWQLAAVAGGAIAAKHLLRLHHRPIFNPAALALVAASLAGVHAQSWWGAASAPQPLLIALLAAGGLLVADRVNRLPMAAAFLGAYWGLLALAAFVGAGARVADAYHAPLPGAALFFAAVMLDDPPTSPGRLHAQVTYALLVAGAAVAVLLITHQPIFLPAGVLVGNAWLAIQRRTQPAITRSQPSGAGPGPQPAPDRLPLPLLGLTAAVVLLGLVVFGNYAMRDVRARPDTPSATQAPTATAPTPPATHPTPPSSDQSTQPASGQPVRLVVRVERLGGDQTMTATVLEPDASGTYGPTGQQAEIRYAAADPLIMGQPSDLRPGAILQVTGTASQANDTIINADQLVNLTGFVPTR
jgi:enediyne biosynthesis protein E5